MFILGKYGKCDRWPMQTNIHITYMSHIHVFHYYYAVAWNTHNPCAAYLTGPTKIEVSWKNATCVGMFSRPQPALYLVHGGSYD